MQKNLFQGFCHQTLKQVFALFCGIQFQHAPDEILFAEEVSLDQGPAVAWLFSCRR